MPAELLDMQKLTPVGQYRLQEARAAKRQLKKTQMKTLDVLWWVTACLYLGVAEIAALPFTLEPAGAGAGRSHLSLSLSPTPAQPAQPTVKSSPTANLWECMGMSLQMLFRAWNLYNLFSTLTLGLPVPYWA